MNDFPSLKQFLLTRPATPHVRAIAVPASARRLSTLPRIDYEDAFVVTTGPTEHRSAEQWARAVFDDAPRGVRTTLTSGWSALGLRQRADADAGFILGWAVQQSTPDHVLLGARSPLGLSAELLLKRRPKSLLFDTFVQHENAAGRAVWAGIEPIHPPIVRYVLEGAARREEESPNRHTTSPVNVSRTSPR
jgi:hypothetical protein